MKKTVANYAERAKKNLFFKKLQKKIKRFFLRFNFYKKLRKKKLSKFALSLPNINDAYALLYSVHPDQTGTCRLSTVPDIKPDSPYLLTIIIPCYNAETFLHECIQSLLNQKTQYKYQLVFVNDGSTDSTPRILETIKNLDNVCIITRENKGLPNARNTGMKYVTSPYLMFVDADDYLSPDCIETLLTKAISENKDIVVGEHAYFYKKKILGKSDYSKTHRLSGFAWNKIFSSTLFQGIGFNENNTFEDTVNVFAVYPQTDNVAFSDKTTYFYRRNKKGLSYTFLKNNRGLDTVYITDRLLKDCLVNDVSKYNPQRIYDLLFRQIAINADRIFNYDMDVQKAVFVVICHWFETYFPTCKTTNSSAIQLEKAIRNRDFASYKIICEKH